MAITFTSKASGDVTMLDANAKQVLELIGKTVGPRGVITAQEAGECIAKLRAAIAPTKPADGASDDGDVAREHVPLATRWQPFIAMLEAAQGRGADVLWGV